MEENKLNEKLIEFSVKRDVRKNFIVSNTEKKDSANTGNDKGILKGIKEIEMGTNQVNKEDIKPESTRRSVTFTDSIQTLGKNSHCDGAKSNNNTNTNNDKTSQLDNEMDVKQNEILDPKDKSEDNVKKFKKKSNNSNSRGNQLARTEKLILGTDLEVMNEGERTLKKTEPGSEIECQVKAIYHKQIETQLLGIKLSPTDSICDKFLDKTCRNRSCAMIHHDMPYLWCTAENGVWKPFDNISNQGLEVDFCRPDKVSTMVSCLLCQPCFVCRVASLSSLSSCIVA